MDMLTIDTLNTHSLTYTQQPTKERKSSPHQNQPSKSCHIYYQAMVLYISTAKISHTRQTDMQGRKKLGAQQQQERKKIKEILPFTLRQKQKLGP